MSWTPLTLPYVYLYLDCLSVGLLEYVSLYLGCWIDEQLDQRGVCACFLASNAPDAPMGDSKFRGSPYSSMEDGISCMFYLTIFSF